MLEHPPTVPPSPPSPPSMPPDAFTQQFNFGMWALFVFGFGLIVVPFLYVLFNGEFWKKKAMTVINTETRRRRAADEAEKTRKAQPHL